MAISISDIGREASSLFFLDELTRYAPVPSTNKSTKPISNFRYPLICDREFILLGHHYEVKEKWWWHEDHHHTW
jgi:hypothetical protein